MTIQETAQQMYDNLELAKRDDGSEFYRTKETVDWQREIIFNAHLDRMPNDDIYSRIYNLLSDVIDNSDRDEDEIRDLVYEQEADCYTSDLTNWLNSDNRNVYYLTEALEEFEIKDGFALLEVAQKRYIEDIGNSLISGIIEHSNNS